MSLETDIKTAIRGLTYISETDKGFRLVTSKNQRIEIRSFTEWFARMTAIEDWSDEAEKERAYKFKALKILLEEHLTDLRVVRIGDVQIDIYIVGTDREGKIVMIKTKSVES